MKTFTLFLFTLGVVMMTIGYMDIFIKSKLIDR